MCIYLLCRLCSLICVIYMYALKYADAWWSYDFVIRVICQIMLFCFLRDDRLLRLILQLLGSLLCRHCCAKFLEAHTAHWSCSEHFATWFSNTTWITSNTRQYQLRAKLTGRLFTSIHNSGYVNLFQASWLSGVQASLLAGELPNDAAANLPFGSPDVVEMSNRRMLQCLIRW